VNYEERSITRRECDRCSLKTEVLNMKEWVKGIDKRQWWMITLGVINLLAALGALAAIVFKMVPAMAQAGIQ